MNNILGILLNLMKNQDFLSMFGRKKDSKGWLWGSIIGMGIGAALVSLGKNRNMMDSIKNMTNNVNSGQKGSIPNFNLATLTEFSKELTPKRRQNNME
ncbi:hypothetical protein IMZ08_05955 [Bacillus luteolus]|uniref:YtxH domain-containing protein n=1 Tax=Litchfieldia luteola TaxID=682179 RepID=A0ABR9QGI5_9BACI|nr:hypothetical protein [Cytobacillus luteolus]MBE4907607.1 hypothetical protein [Cytobacillus luteolus]MBP1944382.1 hypothetical protein [Cytobacillus luteolus]